jgi:hypothetical protein
MSGSMFENWHEKMISENCGGTFLNFTLPFKEKIALTERVISVYKLLSTWEKAIVN